MFTKQDSYLRVLSIDKIDLAAGEISKMKQHIVPDQLLIVTFSFLGLATSLLTFGFKFPDSVLQRQKPRPMKAKLRLTKLVFLDLWTSMLHKPGS